MTTYTAPSARTSGRRFAGLTMAGAAALSLFGAPALAEGPLLTPKTGVDVHYLTATDVDKIIGQVVQEAKARKKPATIAIVDRLGAVLAVYRMAGAPANLPIESNPRGPNAGPPLANGLSRTRRSTHHNHRTRPDATRGDHQGNHRRLSVDIAR